VLSLRYDKDALIVSSLTFHLLPKEKRDRLFEKLTSFHIQRIYIFDRLKGETEEKEAEYKAYFKNNLLQNKLPDELITDLLRENKTNNPDSFDEQKQFFEQKGYSADVIWRNQRHGFIVYCFGK